MSRCFLKPTTKKKKKEKSKTSQVSEKWKWKSLSHVQLCSTPWNCSLPGSSVYGILQAIILEWVVMLFSWGSSQPRDRTWVSCTEGRFFTIWDTWEATHPTPCFTKHKFLAHKLCPLFSKVHSLVQFWADFFTFSPKSCILLCFAIISLCLCYLLVDGGIKTKGETFSLQPPARMLLLSFYWANSSLAIAIVCAWDSPCFTNEEWLTLLHEVISFLQWSYIVTLLI